MGRITRGKAKAGASSRESFPIRRREYIYAFRKPGKCPERMNPFPTNAVPGANKQSVPQKSCGTLC